MSQAALLKDFSLLAGPGPARVDPAVTSTPAAPGQGSKPFSFTLSGSVLGMPPFWLTHLAGLRVRVYVYMCVHECVPALVRAC